MCNAVARPCTQKCTLGSLSVPRRARLLFFEENGKMWEYVVGSGKSCGFLDAYFTGGTQTGFFNNKIYILFKIIEIFWLEFWDVPRNIRGTCSSWNIRCYNRYVCTQLCARHVWLGCMCHDDAIRL